MAPSVSQVVVSRTSSAREPIRSWLRVSCDRPFLRKSSQTSRLRSVRPTRQPETPDPGRTMTTAAGQEVCGRIVSVPRNWMLRDELPTSTATRPAGVTQWSAAVSQ
jgi:hypothetical protein